MASVVQDNVGESEIVFDGTLGGKFLFCSSPWQECTAPAGLSV